MGEGSILLDIASWVVPLVFAIVFHEISHGWAANALGDPTARDLGRIVGAIAGLAGLGVAG